MDKGDKFRTRDGNCVVIKYADCDNVTIQFSKTKSVRVARASDLRKGEVKDLHKPSVCGLGFIGTGPYAGRTHPRLQALWNSMIHRCYNPKWHAKHKGYEDCTVHKRWFNFQNFCTDIVQLPNWDTPGFELDKDLILLNNKVYCKDLCSFVPKALNNVLSGMSFERSTALPKGVVEKANSYGVTITEGGRTRYFGNFNTAEKAQRAYKAAKYKSIVRLLELHKHDVDPRVYRTVSVIANRLRPVKLVAS